MYFFYEENSRKSGIYAIYNRLTNSVYVGSAKEFKERWKDHKKLLENNKHHNHHLQNSYNLYSKQLEHDNFLEFHILQLMPNSNQEKRIKRENYWKKQHEKHKFKLYSKIEVKSGGFCEGKTYEEMYGIERAKEVKLHILFLMEFYQIDKNDPKLCKYK